MADYRFTYDQEIGHEGQSLIPHFPGGLSGVTIGAGYDMGERSAIEIYEDLTQAGIESNIARSFMNAANLKGDAAINWINTHKNLHITEEQQLTLFEQVLVPEYEHNMIQQLIHFADTHPGISPDIVAWNHLSDTQKEMLFDFAYNTGLDEFPKLTEAVLKEDWQTVQEQYERFSDNEPLSYRNESFFNEFLYPNQESEQKYLHEEQESPEDITNKINSFLSTEHHEVENWQDNNHHSSSLITDEWFE